MGGAISIEIGDSAPRRAQPMNLDLNRWLVFVSLSVVVAGGCAKGTPTGLGGSGGGGGDTSEGAAPSGGSGTGATSTGGETGGTTSTTTSDTGGTTTTTTTSSTSTSSNTCASGQHECSGQCFGNTPESGCLMAPPGCAACPVPDNSASSCTPAGACDFSCGTGYSKVAGGCKCDSACCKDADCPSGQTCLGGSCSAGGGGAGGGGACDANSCTAECLAMCIIQMKIGLGSCVGGQCQCQCL